MGFEAKITAIALVTAFVYVITKVQIERLDAQQKTGQKYISPFKELKQNIQLEWKIFKERKAKRREEKEK